MKRSPIFNGYLIDNEAFPISCPLPRLVVWMLPLFNRRRFLKTVEAVWYRPGLGMAFLLLPLTGLYRVLIALRRLVYRLGVMRVEKGPLPVIVVGNIAVGGTGKTPLVIALAELLIAHGYRPGVICRGYRGSTKVWPQRVSADGDPKELGDESILLAQRLHCPVVAGPDRIAAINCLLREDCCDIVISDDGLQHLRLFREVEIVVVDANRGHGNRHCLPTGPLREPLSRLDSVDAVIVNGEMPGGALFSKAFRMTLVLQRPKKLLPPFACRPLIEFVSDPIHALAGIGNPERFFTQLRGVGLEIIEHAYPDHHDFESHELSFGDSFPIFMTEKDAVKCRLFADDRCWFVPVEAHLEPGFCQWLLETVHALVKAGD